MGYIPVILALGRLLHGKSQAQGQPGLAGETLSQKKEKQNRKHVDQDIDKELSHTVAGIIK